jgi:hypothetical protein
MSDTRMTVTTCARHEEELVASRIQPNSGTPKGIMKESHYIAEEDSSDENLTGMSRNCIPYLLTWNCMIYGGLNDFGLLIF